MPFALLAVLGVLGVGGLAYMAGRQSGSGFDLDSCLYNMKKKGYTDEKALQLCREQLEGMIARQKGSLTFTMNEYIIPLAIAGGLGILALKFLKTTKKAIAVNQEELLKTQETLKNLKGLATNVREKVASS
jgi:hypothetical protein